MKLKFFSGLAVTLLIVGCVERQRLPAGKAAEAKVSGRIHVLMKEPPA